MVDNTTSDRRKKKVKKTQAEINAQRGAQSGRRPLGAKDLQRVGENIASPTVPQRTRDALFKAAGGRVAEPVTTKSDVVTPPPTEQRASPETLNEVSVTARRHPTVANAQPTARDRNFGNGKDYLAPGQVANTQAESMGILERGGIQKFGPRDSTLGRQLTGIPTRAERTAQRQNPTPNGRRDLRFGQTRLNLPAANAERVAARDVERAFEQQRRRSSREGAVVGDRNARSFDNFISNTTSRRGQDMRADTANRSQSITARGQNMVADTARRSQDLTNNLGFARLDNDGAIANLRERGANFRDGNRNASFDRRTEANSADRQSQIQANQSAAQVAQNTAAKTEIFSQIDGFFPDDSPQASRVKSTFDELTANGFNPSSSEDVVQISRFFDQVNEELGGKNTITAANFLQPENKAELVKLELWDALLSFNIGSRDQINIPGGGLVPQDELGSLRNRTAQRFNIEDRN